MEVETTIDLITKDLQVILCMSIAPDDLDDDFRDVLLQLADPKFSDGVVILDGHKFEIVKDGVTLFKRSCDSLCAMYSEKSKLDVYGSDDLGAISFSCGFIHRVVISR